MGAKEISTPTNTLDMLIVALCADYERREELIRSGKLKARVEAEYRYFNAKIRNAAEDIVGEGRALIMIKEVGEKRGYAKSEITDMCEKSYKVKKHAVKELIAQRLHLA